MGIIMVVARRLSHRAVSVMCAIYSTVVSGSLLTTIPVHGSAGLSGIITLVSDMFRLSTMDKRQR
jgi:hypothetical protein